MDDGVRAEQDRIGIGVLNDYQLSIYNADYCRLGGHDMGITSCASPEEPA